MTSKKQAQEVAQTAADYYQRQVDSVLSALSSYGPDDLDEEIDDLTKLHKTATSGLKYWRGVLAENS